MASSRTVPKAVLRWIRANIQGPDRATPELESETEAYLHR